MAHNFDGFTVKGVVKIRDAVSDSSKALAAAWKEIQQITRSKTPSRLYTLWFGPYHKTRAAHVFRVINAMDYAINSCSIRIHRDVGDPDFAGALEPDDGWDMKTVKQIVNSDGFQIDIGDALMAPNPDVSETGHFPYAQAFIHELSHVVGFTHDVGADHVAGARAIHLSSQTTEYYGVAKSKWLARTNPNFAIAHADSYGFYCSYQLDPSKC